MQKMIAMLQKNPDLLNKFHAQNPISDKELAERTRNNCGEDLHAFMYESDKTKLNVYQRHHSIYEENKEYIDDLRAEALKTGEMFMAVIVNRMLIQGNEMLKYCRCYMGDLDEQKTY